VTPEAEPAVSRRPDAPHPTSLQLILTAERLFAIDGVAGVSLRAIATAAGSANTSAVHYYFGSKAGLVQAIIAHRMPDLLQRRSQLRAEIDPRTLRDALEVHLRPVLELADRPDTRYVSFLDQLGPSGIERRLVDALPAVTSSQRAFVADVERAVTAVPRRALRTRIDDVQAFNLHAAASRERAIALGYPSAPFSSFAGGLLDGFAGYLTAPVAARTGQRSVVTGPGTP